MKLGVILFLIPITLILATAYLANFATTVVADAQLTSTNQTIGGTSNQTIGGTSSDTDFCVQSPTYPGCSPTGILETINETNQTATSAAATNEFCVAFPSYPLCSPDTILTTMQSENETITVGDCQLDRSGECYDYTRGAIYVPVNDGLVTLPQVTGTKSYNITDGVAVLPFRTK